MTPSAAARGHTARSSLKPFGIFMYVLKIRVSITHFRPVKQRCIFPSQPRWLSGAHIYHFPLVMVGLFYKLMAFLARRGEAA